MTKEGKSEASRIGPSSASDKSTISGSVDATGASTKSSTNEGALSLRAGEKIEFESQFTRLLKDSANTAAFIAYLKSLSPAATDLELRALKTYAPLTEVVAFIRALTATLERHTDYELVQAWMTMLLRIHGDIILAHATKKTKKTKKSIKKQEESGEEDDDDDDDDEDDDGLLIKRNVNDDSDEEEDDDDNEWTVYLPELVSALSAWEEVQLSESNRLGELTQYCSGVIDF